MNNKEKQLYLKMHKEKQGSMEMCKKDCKEKECFKGKYCQDIYIQFVYGKVKEA